MVEERDETEAAPINASDIGSAGRLGRNGGDVFAAGASTVAVLLPQALAWTFQIKVFSGEARRSRSWHMLCAVHQDQPQQFYVRVAARRRASVFADPLRCLVSLTRQSRKATSHIAVGADVVRPCVEG